MSVFDRLKKILSECFNTGYSRKVVIFSQFFQGYEIKGGGGHDVRIRGRNSDLAGGVKFCT